MFLLPFLCSVVAFADAPSWGDEDASAPVENVIEPSVPDEQIEPSGDPIGTIERDDEDFDVYDKLFPDDIPTAAPIEVDSPVEVDSAVEVDFPVEVDSPAVGDPLEPLNRVVFAFNWWFDRYLLRPLAEGWDAAPDEATDRVHNLLSNVAEPLSAANSALQGDRIGLGNAVARLLLNVVVGLGVFDVASAVGVGGQKTDLGITLGKWGIGNDPYLVVPFLGPSSVRDFGGTLVDNYFAPFTIAERNDKMTFFEYGSIHGVDKVDKRSLILPELAELEASSLDFYAAVRAVYRQRRAALVRGKIHTFTGVVRGEDGGGEQVIDLLDLLDEME